MAKDRTSIPPETVAAVMLACDRTCCVCQVPGKFLQVHHIDENPANHASDNLAALCFQCHGETQIRGGFGRKLDAHQVVEFRTDWTTRVAVRKQRADDLATHALAGVDARVGPLTHEVVPFNFEPPVMPERISLTAYVNALPTIREAAYREAEPGWAGSTVGMVQATALVADVMREILVRLARYYPKGHFGDDSEAFLADQIASRQHWHRHIVASYGHGHSGTIVGPSASLGVLEDLEQMVEQMVGSLVFSGEPPDEMEWEEWRGRWRWLPNQGAAHLAVDDRRVDAPKPVGVRCPFCGEHSMYAVSSELDKVFGDLGGVRRMYVCGACGKDETRMGLPQELP